MPARAISSEAVLELALEALRRVSGVEATAELVGAASERIEAAQDRPLTCAVVGEPEARAAVLNRLLGDELVAAQTRGAGAPALALRRSERLACRIHHPDGTIEEHVSRRRLEAPSPGPDRGERRSEALALVTRREAELERSRRALPSWLRQRPPWWAVWLWLARWIGGLLLRRRREDHDRAAAALSDARRELAAAEGGGPRQLAATGGEPSELPALIEAIAERTGVWIEIELSGTPLPDGVMAVDLPEVNAAGRFGLDLDGCVLAGDPRAPGTEALPRSVQADLSRLFVIGSSATAVAIPVTRRDSWLPIGETAAALHRLPELLGGERAVRLGRRALEAVRAARAELDDEVESTEAELESRLEAWRRLRLEHPAAFARAQLDALRPAVTRQIQELIQQASVQLGAELEELSARWRAELRAAGSSDELRAATARIESEGPAALRAARDEAQQLLDAGLRGGAIELFPRLLEALPGAELGAPAPPEAPTVVPVEIAPALAQGDDGMQLGPSSSRLRSLFRSLESRKARRLEELDQRLGWLRGLASAELLDAEPALEASLLDPLRDALAAAIEAHEAWVAERLAEEHVAVTRARAELEPTAQLRQQARQDEIRLARSLETTAAALRPTG